MASLLRRPRSNITSSQHIKSELQVSAYDRYASMLIALLIVVGFAVVILFLLWLTTRVYAKQELPKVLLDNFGDGAPLGNAEDLEELRNCPMSKSHKWPTRWTRSPS